MQCPGRFGGLARRRLRYHFGPAVESADRVSLIRELDVAAEASSDGASMGQCDLQHGHFACPGVTR